MLYFHSSSNMGEFAKDIKMVAALQEDEQGGDKLLDAARRLANAFSDLMNTVQPGTKEVSQIATRTRSP